MRIIRLFFTWMAVIFLIAIFGLKLTGNDHLRKAVANTYLVGQVGPGIDEYDIFESRIVKTGSPTKIPVGDKYRKLKVDGDLMEKIESYDPAALLIIENGNIIYDRYWEGYSAESLTNSFSAGKSIVGLSIGKCIDLGLIKDIDQKVIDVIPELNGKFRDQVTFKHLMQMTSGINFDESYGNPFGFMAKAYYGTELLEETLKYEAEIEPGSVWKYSGGNTILLGVIVERVSGQNISDFVSTHFWKPLGAAHEALWNLDKKDGIEKAYCCFYSNAEDFSRFGSLLLNDGMAYGKRILSRSFMDEMKKPVVLNSGEVIPHYGYQCWKVQYRDENIVYARGIFGQYIIAIPELNVVIVRLGHRRGDKDDKNHPIDVYHYIDLAYDLSSQ